MMYPLSFIAHRSSPQADVRLPAARSAPASVRVPGFWEIPWHTIRRLALGPMAALGPNAERDSLILDVAVALRAGRVDAAAALLAPHSAALARDAAYLNLMGVCCELRRQWKLAKRFYGVAMSVDSSYRPAQQNMRRLYELYTFGSSREGISLGDAELRSRRALK